MVTYSDTFAGSGALGVTEVGGIAWEAITGTWSRSGGKASTSTSVSSNPIAAISTTSNVEVSLDVGGGNDALYFRVVDASNWWRIISAAYTNSQTSTQYIWGGTAVHQDHGVAGAASPSSEYFTINSGSPTQGPSTPYNLYVNHTHNSVNYNTAYVISSWSYVGPQTSTYDVTTYRALLQKCVNGVITTVSTSNSLTSRPTSYRVRARADVITPYVNGTPWTDTTDATHVTALKHGIGAGVGASGGTSSIDNFSLTLLEPPAPTIDSPTAGSVVSTAQPSLVGTLGAGYGIQSQIEWQLATDAGFTQNLRTLQSASATSGQITRALSVAEKLTQTTWYLRARTRDVNAIYSAWTSAITFSVSHPPGAINLRPTGGGGLAHGATSRFEWTFSDPYTLDTQTAFEIEIQRNDTGAVVYDSGKITSTNQYVDYAIAAGLRDVALRWRLMVWDSENVASPFSTWQVFVPSLPPTVTITAPTNGGTVTSGAPVVTWTFAASGGRTQATWRVVFVRVSDNVTILDSGLQTGSASTYTPPSSILKNDIQYSVTVSVVDSTGIAGTSTSTFTTQYVAPEMIDFTVSSLGYESLGYVDVNWNNIESDASFLFWRLYRREVGEEAWTLLAEIPTVTTTNYKDRLVPSQTYQQYAIVQVVERFNEQVESEASQVAEIYVEAGGYWFIDPITPELSARLYNVHEESFKRNRERSELVVVGRGRHVDVGENIGISGSLTARIRTTEGGLSARKKRLHLEELSERGEPVYLRNPFGDIILISLQDIEFSRVSGVGPSEFVDLTLPYLEVGY